jgi:hypothetical protein
MKNLDGVFDELKAILQPYAEQLDVKVGLGFRAIH